VIVGGIGGRVAMRVVALTAGSADQGTLTEAEEVVGVISADGTVGLIFFVGVFSGLFGGLVYAAMRPWTAAAGPWKGLAFGAILLATLGWTVIERDNFDFHRFGYASLNIAMFAALFLLFGLLIAPLYDFFDGCLQPVSLRLSGIAGLAARVFGSLAAAASVSISVSGGEVSADGVEGLFASLLPSYLLLAMPLAAAATARAAGRFGRMTDLRGYPAAMTIAVVALVVPVAIGLSLDTRALVHILRQA
jgi:uncharacterized membrane protein YagU involved in acid resistance